MQALILVGMGGAVGAIARYVAGTRLPHSTLAVNALGGLLMGLLVGWLAHRGGADQERWRLLLGVGVLGGFTTFSAFSLDVAVMIERRAYGPASFYVAASVVLSVLALFAGLIVARRVFA